MTKVYFEDNLSIHVIAPDGETFFLEAYLPVPKEHQKPITDQIAHYFDKNFSDDKSSMIYWVLMDMMANTGFSFRSRGSDRNEERIRIGNRIRELREAKKMEAKQLAFLAHIDAANLSRIEKGKYSVGLDILSRIAQVLGAKVDLV